MGQQGKLVQTTGSVSAWLQSKVGDLAITLPGKGFSVVLSSILSYIITPKWKQGFIFNMNLFQTGFT